MRDRNDRWLPYLTLAVLGVCLGVASLRAEEKKGAITGKVDKPELVTAVTAIDRETDKKFPGKLDGKTGQFTIEGLPAGKVFDCLIDLAGARLEGVNLKVPRSDYEEEQPLTKEEAETIKKTVLSLNQFEDKVEVMTITGNIQHAAVLLNKVRTKPFVNSNPGEVIWRLELWRFEKPEETWVKVQDELFLVLYRERLQKSAFEKKSLTLDPALGGLRVTDKEPTVNVGSITLPSKEPGIGLRAEKTAKAETGKDG